MLLSPTVSITRNDGALLSCSLTSADEVVSCGGTVVGNPVFTQNGMQPNGAGSVRFDNIGKSFLTWEGQISIVVTTADISQYDDSPTWVTGSKGVDHSSGFAQLFSVIDSSASETARCIVTNAERLEARLDSGETDNGAYVHSEAHGEYAEVCLWWKGDDAGILVDGSETIRFKRTTSIGKDFFTSIVVGANSSGAYRYFSGTIKSIAVASFAPSLATRTSIRSIQFFGDSYAAHSSEVTALPRCDCTVRRLMMKGTNGVYYPAVFRDGNGGYSVCDTGSSDLSTVVDAAASKGAEIIVFMAGNNDVDASDSQIADASTGTDANYKSFITKFLNNQSTRKIYITTAGSLMQDTNLNTAAKKSRLVTINNIIRGLPAWADSQFPNRVGAVELIDLHSLFGGDVEGNRNYKGYIDNLGNATIPAGGGETDRHPSFYGHRILATEIQNRVGNMI